MSSSCAITLIVLQAVMGVVVAEFNYTILPSNFLIVQQGEIANLQMNLTGLTNDILIEVSSSDTSRFILEQTIFQVSPVYDSSQILQADGIQTIMIPIRGISFSIETIQFVVRDRSGLINPSFEIQPFVVKVTRQASIVGTVFTYVLLVWLMLSYITMGVKLDWTTIKGKLKRPFGVVIGAICQFVVMPGVAALLARILNLELTAAVALIIVGSCPGGWLSNIFTLLLDCDLVLSLTMTFCSTVIALAFMPLNLFIYATPYAAGNSNVRIPFLQIFLQLITLVVPLLIGTFIAHRYPRAAKWFQRLLKPLALFLIIVGFAAGLWTNYFAFGSPAEIYLSAIILPCIAGLLGFFIAKLTCLSNRSAVTIAIETGAQNGLLATSVIALSFPQPEADLMTRVPVLFVTFTFIQGFVIMTIYVVMNRFPGRFELPDDTDIDNEEKNNDPETSPSDSHNSKPDMSSRIKGIGPKQLKKSAEQKSQKPSWATSKTTQVDFDEISRSSAKSFHVNRAFVDDFEPLRRNTKNDSSVTRSPVTRSSYMISNGNVNDTDAINSNARQVYL